MMRTLATQRPADRPPGAPAPAVVHVVDIDAEARRRLSDLLEGVGLEPRTYASLGEFLACGHLEAPGCLVVDARAALFQAPGLRGGYPTVVTAQRADVAMAVRAMKTGAVDFVEKPFCEPDILGAIDAAIEVDRERRQAASRSAELRERYAKLTPRERQVMALVTAGRLNKQVAGDLGLSEITVKVHRGSAMRKMAARTLPDLVRMADALGGAADHSAA